MYYNEFSTLLAASTIPPVTRTQKPTRESRERDRKVYTRLKGKPKKKTEHSYEMEDLFEMPEQLFDQSV